MGLDTRPVFMHEACRRLFADLVGYLPPLGEAELTCAGRPWGQVVDELLAKKEFVELGQRRWADLLRYHNESISVERIFDMDDLVGKLYRGLVSYDQFAAVVSAHPVVTRRYDSAADRAEAVFSLFMGRPPYSNERSDLARLYTLWDSGYYDHPVLLQRLPDAFIRYRCLPPKGESDPGAAGQCTSTLWGFNELTLVPDLRADEEGRMWSGLLRPSEWEALQLPGRILASQSTFWEQAVGRVLSQYLGYDLGIDAPSVRQELARYLIEHNGDLRALHYAVATSQVYLHSSTGATPTAHRFTYGPLKQVQVEPWIDTITRATGFRLSACDHRIAQPEDFLGEGSLSGLALIHASRWELTSEGEIDSDYRDLARTLGGCPDNDVGGRFKTISILTTAIQESFVEQVCDPLLVPEQGAAEQGAAEQGAELTRLLPAGIEPQSALDAATSERIFSHQLELFFGRPAAPHELAWARAGADACLPKPCTAEMYARPVCYALLSSGEMLFY